MELTTGDISGKCDGRRNLLEWSEQAARATGGSYEIIAAGPHPVRGMAEMSRELPLRFLEVPGGTYYALKNAGANASTGEIVFFTDLDCRPAATTLTTLVRAFEDPATTFVAGRTFYEGPGLLTLLNSAHSFGDLLAGQDHFDRDHIVNGHNVGLRREFLARDPFGPFGGRTGGDRYITDAMRATGRNIRLLPEMIVLHEDMTYKLRALLERHFRDCVVATDYGTERQSFAAAPTVARTLVLAPARRLRRVLKARRHLGFRLPHLAVAVALNAFYWALDLVAVAVMLLVPPLRRRWLGYQFGAPLTSTDR